MLEVKKETKFVVMTIKDILKYLREDEQVSLTSILLTIEEGRSKDGKAPVNKYISCNQDEPYAEKVWQTILDGERTKLLLAEIKRLHDQLEAIPPVGAEYSANRYDTGNEMKLHVWPTKGGESYDISAEKGAK